MKIAVLNGSPKGEISVTVQYIKFIQKKFPQHELKLLNISHEIQELEKDDKAFQDVIAEVEKSDGVIWAFPLYVFLVASQYKRFIEMIWEKKVADAFKGKYTCVISTSIHFFDNTAHNYMRGICDDLDMKFTESFSADMDDIFNDEKRRILLKWAADFFTAIEKQSPTSKAYAPVVPGKFSYKPGSVKSKIDSQGQRIKILADITDSNSNIAKMVNRFKDSVKEGVQIFNVRDVNMKGGCLGCMQCAFDNICFYKDKDDFMEFFNTEMRDADVTIFASEIKDRFITSRIKMFWDRRFFNGHIPLNINKQIGFIISGPLGQLANLQEILQGLAEMSDANFTGVVTDECGDSAQLDALIDDFAAKCVDYSTQKYVRPRTFLGVGGHKIFRDQIWARLRFPFQADYKFYAEHGMFDFPQDDKRYVEFSQQMTNMIQDPKMRDVVRKMIKTEMLKGYQKVVETK
ncbi:MAG: NAD(P)H-dependent oxidoreductase [Chloroflexi bacterium]|nr:NAD(P)H-dependent oxidoreductase [Chloroflexota bacterium]